MITSIQLNTEMYYLVQPYKITKYLQGRRHTRTTQEDSGNQQTLTSAKFPHTYKEQLQALT